MSYRMEKIGLAIRSLVGSGSMQDRLYNAFVYSLVVLNVDDFPERQLVREYEEIRRNLTLRPAIADEGTAKATINSMSNEEAQEYAYRILNLYNEVCEKDYK